MALWPFHPGRRVTAEAYREELKTGRDLRGLKEGNAQVQFKRMFTTAAAKAGGAADVAGKTVGRGAATAGRAVGKAAVTGGKAVGNGAATMGKTVGHGAATAGKAAGKGTVAGGKAAGRGAVAGGKAAGKGIGKAVTSDAAKRAYGEIWNAAVTRGRDIVIGWLTPSRAPSGRPRKRR
jgi:hypothetical protein